MAYNPYNGEEWHADIVVIVDGGIPDDPDVGNEHSAQHTGVAGQVEDPLDTVKQLLIRQQPQRRSIHQGATQFDFAIQSWWVVGANRNALYYPVMSSHFLHSLGNYTRGAIFPEMCKINQSRLSPFDWLLDWR